eukprot:TRINITY_DN2946_c0_g1_i2.p1 TRINITY_DN2946_c0_g1~~TRINITY_DN2946_c0_g1_i2.p1  ORF type:complete len:205 (-),score=86.65 TRINITY_DN2946_c0_g1_i2:91-705(-)
MITPTATPPPPVKRATLVFFLSLDIFVLFCLYSASLLIDDGGSEVRPPAMIGNNMPPVGDRGHVINEPKSGGNKKQQPQNAQTETDGKKGPKDPDPVELAIEEAEEEREEEEESHEEKKPKTRPVNGAEQLHDEEKREEEEQKEMKQEEKEVEVEEGEEKAAHQHHEAAKDLSPTEDEETTTKTTTTTTTNEQDENETATATAA